MVISLRTNIIKQVLINKRLESPLPRRNHDTLSSLEELYTEVHEVCSTYQDPVEGVCMSNIRTFCICPWAVSGHPEFVHEQYPDILHLSIRVYMSNIRTSWICSWAVSGHPAFIHACVYEQYPAFVDADVHDWVDASMHFIFGRLIPFWSLGSESSHLKPSISGCSCQLLPLPPRVIHLSAIIFTVLYV